MPASIQSPARILVVDDHPVVRQGLIACLSRYPNLTVIGEAADGYDAIQKAEDLAPHLVLMDVEMPSLNGLAATELICRKFPAIKVLILSMHQNPDYAVEAIQKGARGFELKTASSEELLKAIYIVLRGEPFFPNRSGFGQNQHSKATPSATDGLFEREREVLIYLAMGYSNRDIAGFLAISVRTVESHRARLMRKLGIHTIAGLTRYALSKGHISLDPMAADAITIGIPPNSPSLDHNLRI